MKDSDETRDMTDKEIYDEIKRISEQAYRKFPEQITIDLIQEAEQLLLEEVDKKLPEKIGAHLYNIGIVLEVMNPELTYDIELLESLDKVLRELKEGLEWANKILYKAKKEAL